MLFYHDIWKCPFYIKLKICKTVNTSNVLVIDEHQHCFVVHFVKHRSTYFLLAAIQNVVSYECRMASNKVKPQKWEQRIQWPISMWLWSAASPVAGLQTCTLVIKYKYGQPCDACYKSFHGTSCKTSPPPPPPPQATIVHQFWTPPGVHRVGPVCASLLYASF